MDQLACKTPDWVKDAVFYQIFPDRFASSSRVVKPTNLETWGSPPTVHGFKGGDLLGAAEHLEYLQDLGITAILFTPIFQSAANHRYHTYDYFRVDPILGGDAAFKTLLDSAHARGIRIILDGVFNHTSRGFYQFHHALENGAASPYIDWFTFDSFPVKAYGAKPNYKAWWNLPALPKLNHANPQVREFLYGVAEYWLGRGIDGWRLDVPSEIDDDSFWQEFRNRVKRINPDAYIVGEIWERGDRWLAGDQFDAVMNYQFTRALLSFLVQATSRSQPLLQEQSYGEVHPTDAAGLARDLTDILSWHPREITLAQLNLLDSHDTARFLTIVHGDTTLLKLAFLIMFTFPGAPMIYYGDEVGMQGRRDPDCRRSMLWDSARWDTGLLDSVKRMTAARHKYQALRRGEFTVLYAQGRTLVFARHQPGEAVITALNAGSEDARLDLALRDLGISEGEIRGEWSSESLPIADGQVKDFVLPARTGRLWIVHTA